MNFITVSDNIFNDSSVTIDYLMSDKSVVIDAVGLIQLKITGEDNEYEFEEFFDLFLNRLQWSYDLYFIYSQNHKARKSKARSYTKLFYDLKRQRDFAEGLMADREVDLAPGYSNMVGMIKVNGLGNTLLTDELMLKHFRYGYAVRKEENHFDLEHYVGWMDKDLFEEGKSLSINSVKLIEKYITAHSFLFSYVFDGNDDLLFTVYAGKQAYSEVEDIMTTIAAKINALEKRTADSSEIDKIIELFFNSSRVEKS